MNLKDSFCSVDDGEMFVIGMHISPYEMGNRFNRDPMRKKRLLLHKREIMKLFGQSQQQGLSIIPLSLYLSNGRAKLEIGLCKGKKLYDKRAVQAKRIQKDRSNVHSRKIITDIDTLIYGGERLSTGLLSLGQRVAELHRFKSNNLK